MYIKTITTLAITAIVLLAAVGVPNVLADELASPQPIANASHIVLALGNHTYYPDDVVSIYVHDAADPLVSIVDPLNNTYSIPLTGVNNSSFMGEYALSQGIILGNYTVIAVDNATGDSAQDIFEVTTRTVAVTPTTAPGNTTAERPAYYLYVNLSQTDYLPGDKAVITLETNAGTPTVVVQDPANNTAYPECKKTGDNSYSATYRLDKAVVLGSYTVLAYVNENGTFSYAIAGFNVTMGNKADKGLHIQYAAYDPVQKAVVLRANISSASSDTVAVVKNDPKVKGMAVKGVKVLDSGSTDNISISQAVKNEDKKVEVVIPVDNNNVDAVTSQYNLTRDITKATTSVAVSSDGENIHLFLNDKVDGCWYRMSTSIPAGYQVQKIERADGTEIKNDVQINRSTGEYVQNDVNWYVDNGTLYFYDDPINGYDITLLPPAANNSLAVNVIYGGQLSAIVYPFNQTDSNTVIAGNDHLGRNGDSNYANNIDGDAGSKTAIRLYRNNQVSNGNLRMFGDNGTNYATYSNTAYKYTDIGQPVTVGFNTVPDGSVESVIISNYRTPVAGSVTSYINITQKTIIRNNNLWFATVYYLNNSGGNSQNGVAFFQGADFNFNGQYQNDDDFYNQTNDFVYGYMNNQNSNSIHVGGFGSTIQSSDHDVATYGNIWNRINSNNLQGGTSTSGIDGGMALEWDYSGSLANGDTWVVPVVWAVGKDVNSFGNTLNYALDHNVYDVGIKSIDVPANGDSLDSQTTPVLAINATAIDLGVTDQSPTVYLQIKNSTGAVVYSASTAVKLSIPYQETALASFNWNLSNVTAGTYNISVYTQMAGDQNASNDLKSITVYVQSLSIYPDQWVHANPGDNVLFPLNLSNLGTARTFDLSLSPSTAGWASYLYYNNTSTLLANDTNGDGAWDWVNASYTDSGKPAITVPANGKASLILQKLVPATADTGILDTVTLYAYPSGQPLANSSATLKTDTPLGAVANKTFYFHSLYLNTTPEAATTGSKAITSIFYMWAQTPSFADSFTISGNVSVPIYYNSTAAMPITVTLFYTNGAGNSVQIGTNTSTVPASASQTTPSMFNFTLYQAGGNITVPRGSYIVAKIDNQQTTAFTVWYTSAYRSRIDVKTPTYVHVGSINTYNGGISTSNFNTGDTVYVTANVTDPIGAYDIRDNATISVTAPNGSYIVNNQSMALNKTDSSSPALWKLYNYSLQLDSSFQPGVYGINITGYESNGVINRKNISITLTSGTPAILVYPNSTRIAEGASVVSFKHRVTNLNAYKSDVVDISCNVPAGWSYSLYKADGITPLTDTDGDTKLDTGTLSPLGSTDIVVKVTVSSGGSSGNTYPVYVTGTSSQDTSVSSTAMDTVLISTSSVVKTLYLHNNGTQFMNTSMNNSTNDHTDINNGNSMSWAQSPAFAKDFNILDDPMATLYVQSSDTNLNMNVSIIASNSTSSTVLGWYIYKNTTTSGAITPLSFNVPLNKYNLTIPRGSQLSVNINNLNNKKLTIYHSTQCPSRIDMDTYSYINVKSVTINNTSGNPITGATPPSTINVTANVTDPFGSFDIINVNVSLIYPNGTVAIGPLAMNLSGTDPAALSQWKQFTRNITLNASLDSGDYSILVTANESNGVKSSLSTGLAIVYPVNVSASKSYSPSGEDEFTVTITITNKDNHTVDGVHAYDFYADDFTVDGIDSPYTTVIVNNAILQGNINVFGPFTLSPYETKKITYTAYGIGDYNLSNMTIVGVDPYI